MKILTFIDYYLPGFKAGGPIRSLSAMVEALPPELEFWIVTRDRDFTDRHPFPGIRANVWCDVGRAKVLYLSRWATNTLNVARIAKKERPDIVYLNSLFSRLSIRYMGARRIGLVPKVPLVVAPRGEMSPGALHLKTLKKRTFMNLATTLNVFEGFVWQASSNHEKVDIIHALRRMATVAVSPNVTVATDVVSAVEGRPLGTREPKKPGVVKFVFVSRISPMKNLVQAIRLMGRLRGQVKFDIFGPIDDPLYWRRCETAIRELPPNVKVDYRGELPHDKVAHAFSEREFFVFPTLGENFGHVIYEALTARCPIVLSNTTPWAVIDTEGAGWIIPLADEAKWVATLQSCVDMDAAEHNEMGRRGPATAIAFAGNDNVLEMNVRMFQNAMK